MYITNQFQNLLLGGGGGGGVKSVGTAEVTLNSKEEKKLCRLLS
jgi:hypothetical protein